MIIVARLFAAASASSFVLAAVLPFWYSWHLIVLWSALGLLTYGVSREEMRMARARTDRRRLELAS